MTAEEFFRKKIKEKNPNIDVVTLSTYLMTAEEAMIWSHEFSQLEKSEKPIIPEISDEEIKKTAKEKHVGLSRDVANYRECFEQGAKWYRERLKSKGAEQ